MKIKYLFLILILLLNNKISYSGVIDPNTPDSKYIEYGKKYKCVVRISNLTNNNQKALASAVVVDPKWAITAAHVVKDTSNNKIILDDESEIKIDEIFIPEEFNNEFGYYDIAICKLNKDIILDFYPELYEDDDEVGKIAGMAGFGITGVFSSTQRVGGGVRRAGSNKIDGIDRGLLVCTPSRQNRTELEFLISPGDSGGGLFINKKLAGINSCVMAVDKKPDSTYGDESGHTRVSLHKRWIKKIISKP